MGESFLRRVLAAGAPASAPPEVLDPITTRNGALLAMACLATSSGLVLLLVGSMFHGMMASLAGLSAALGLAIAARGRARLGVLVTVGILNVLVTIGVTAEGSDNLAVLHILAVCLPFSLFPPRERVGVLIGVAVAVAGMVVSAVPLVPSPWLPGRADVVSNVRAVASIGVAMVLAAQLWLFLTSRERSEARLSRAVAKAKAANLAKSAFLADMSHEVRTPINGVLGMLGILEGTRLDPMQREYVQTARASGRALLDVINDILDLSKVEAGQLRLEREAVSLRATLQQVLDQFAFQTAQAQLEVVLRYVPGTPDRVVVDAGRIRQVVTNLVSNAIKFTEQGHVLVTVECQEQTEAKANLRVSVKDTGPGIPVDQQAMVFDKFRQVHASAAMRSAGTGLGLSITRALVQRMGGEIGLKSTEGEGSTFWFSLPVSVVPPVEPSPPAEALADRSVLLVDEHPVARRVLVEQLKAAGARASASTNGGDATARARDGQARGEPFDVVVIDAETSQVDGVGLAARLSDDEALGQPLVVMMTSVTQPIEVDALECSGVAGHLTKPVHGARLVDVLVNAIRVREQGGDRPLIAAIDPPSTSEPTERFEGLRVLVVDDNAVNQKVAAKMLERMGCEVTVVGSGRAALAEAEGWAYDAVFMDVEMPMLDGLSATRALRKMGVTTPIVAMTAHAMQGDRRRCLAAGMDGYVSKPVEREVLREELARVLAGG